MWHEAGTGDEHILRWGISLLHELGDPSWKALHLGNLRWWISQYACQLHYYKGGDYDVLCVLQQSPAPGDFQAIAFLVSGEVEPATVAELLAAKLGSLSRERGVKRVMGKFAKSSRSVPHLTAIEQRSDVKVTVLQETENTASWRFESKPPTAKDPFRTLRAATERHAARG